MNPRTEWEIDWNKKIELEGSVPVSFEPFHGLWPIYATCYGVENGYAVLKFPTEFSDNADWRVKWLPDVDDDREWLWAVVPEIFIRPQ